jgi:hypothetical protein
MHTLLDLRGPIPSFIHISDGKMGDAAALDLIMPEAGAIYVMDRGYVDFRRLYALHQAGAFFVTRTKINMNRQSVGQASPLDRDPARRERRLPQSDGRRRGYRHTHARVHHRARRRRAGVRAQACH